ncbi:TPA: SH3 domain-containing protein [Neisseria subflava]|jgi:bacterial SH3 domain protein
MKKAFSIFSISLLTLTLLTACNRSENETKKELNALKEQLAQQQKLQAERENQELEHRKQIEQRQRENEIYEQAYQSAQEDLKMQQMLEEEQRQEEAKQKRAQEEEQKQDEVKKRLAIEEERKQEEAKKKLEQEEKKKKQQEETKKAEEKKTAAPKPTEKLTRYPAFVITASGSGTINLRGGPSTSNIAVKQLRDGQDLQVIAETNKCEDAGGGCWVKVQVGDLKGYVSNAYLQRGTASDNYILRGGY